MKPTDANAHQPRPDAENERLVRSFAAVWAAGGFDLAALRRAANPPPSDRHAHLVCRRKDIRVAGGAGERPARVYWPHRKHPTGVLVYFHGGGFVAGGLETAEGVCCTLTALAGCVTINVDYRLAPEHRFPAGVEDAHAALNWAFDHAEALGAPRRIAVGGDSAGGTLATVASMMCRDRGESLPAFQLLFYPGINLDMDTPERNALGRMGYILQPDVIDWLNSFYCARPEMFETPYCTPARAEDFSRLPTALIIAGDCDPLCFEAAWYAERLQAAGVRARYSQYNGAAHGFVGAFEVSSKGRAALKEAAMHLRLALKTPTDEND